MVVETRFWGTELLAHTSLLSKIEVEIGVAHRGCSLGPLLLAISGTDDSDSCFSYLQRLWNVSVPCDDVVRAQARGCGCGCAADYSVKWLWLIFYCGGKLRILRK